MATATATREDLRNVAIVAHVDHGKTTLVDAMLLAVRRLPREPGRQRARHGLDGPRAREGHHDPRQEHRGPVTASVKLNIVDTPGHADFGGEVERGLTMVDGVLLLVDASEGPLPQTRFVLRKALEAHLPVILVVNKVDRPDARIAEVVDEVYELFLDLDADEYQIEFPIVYTNAKAGWASLERGRRGHRPRAADRPAGRARSRRPSYDPGHPLQAHVTNLDASPYVGRLAICRVRNGTIRKRPADRLVPRRRQRSTRAQVAELYVTEALDRVDADEAGPGEIIAVAGTARRDDRRDARRPRGPAPAAGDPRRRAVDLGHDRHQHVAARRAARASKLTARQIKDRLDAGAGRQRLAPRARRPSARTPGRSRAAASCSSRCSSR